MRRTSWLAILIVVVVGSVVGIAGGSFLAKWIDYSRRVGGGGWGALFERPFGNKAYVTILMIGEDDTSKTNGRGNGLSDTLVVFAIDTNNKDIRAVSIPRDTRVEVPGHGIGKINSAHVFGGTKLATQVVSNLLQVPIDYYVKTNTTGLRGMVDLLGGVYIVVDKDMRYNDRHGKLHINLHASPNKQLLNGREAEGYVRFRHDAVGDYGWTMKDGKKVAVGRVVRQQYFLRSLANRVLALPGRDERADYLAKCYDKKYIVSNLKIRDWDGLAEFLKDIKPEKIAMQVMPGTPQNIGGASYVVPDEEKLRDVAERYLQFLGPVDGEDIAKVEVLNGSGIGGVAKSVADKLKAAGFEVTRTDNAKTSNYDRCVIIAYNSKTSDPVRRIAGMLNCSDIREESKHNGQADVTVIVGRDYNP